MKTGINNIYKGFGGRKTRFSSEILQFLNDFYDFWLFFLQKIKNRQKMHTIWACV
jgi:hypothetical protein